MQLKAWDEFLSTEETNSFCKELAFSLTGRMSDQQLRFTLEEKLISGDWAYFGEYKPPYDRLSTIDSLLLVQVLALFSKREDIDLGIDKQEVAYEKFVASERRCDETNRIFKAWGFGRFQFSPDVERVLYAAQRKISSCLGNVPEVSSLRCRFGPGATTQVPKRTASAREKLGKRFACSEELAPEVSKLLEELPAWIPFTEDSDTATVTVELHPGQLHFVPKNARTNRSIVVEPSLNSFFQLGVGDYIADRLRTRGIDIRNQTTNQDLAQIASLYGELATLDLSSASDLIARELVAHLLPIDWFLFLDSLRTGTVEYEGTPMKLQKFSSMGNGFTFPLETLIFWALSSSCVDETKGEFASVYGDDIIVPVSSVELLRAVLNACGFLLNAEKSFWSGPFRESCGKDYHSGMLIRPVFLKDRLSGESAFVMHNFFVRHGDPESAAIVLRYILPELQLFGPDGYGDGHLLGDFIALPYGSHDPRKRAKQWGGYTFDTYTWVSRKSFRPTPGDYVYPSYAVYLREGRQDPFADKQVEMLARLGTKLFRHVYGDEAFKRVTKSLQGLDSSPTPFSKKTSSFGVTLPGKKGYKRISIYTLAI